jgi:hypothetical protein
VLAPPGRRLTAQKQAAVDGPREGGQPSPSAAR